MALNRNQGCFTLALGGNWKGGSVLLFQGSLEEGGDRVDSTRLAWVLRLVPVGLLLQERDPRRAWRGLWEMRSQQLGQPNHQPLPSLPLDRAA